MVAGGEVIMRNRICEDFHSIAAALDAVGHVVKFDIAEHGRLDTAVGDVGAALVRGVAVLRITVAMLDLREGKLHGVWISVLRQEVDDRSARIAKLKQFGHLVEGLSGGVVASVAYVAVGPTAFLALGKVEVRVATAHDKGKHGKLQIAVSILTLFQQYGVDMSFKMVHCDQRFFEREGQAFGIAEPNEQRARESRTLCDGDGVDGFVRLAGVFERLADDWHDCSQMLTGS